MDTTGVGLRRCALLQSVQEAVRPTGVDRSKVPIKLRVLRFGGLPPHRPTTIKVVMEERLRTPDTGNIERGIPSRVVVTLNLTKRSTHNTTSPLLIWEYRDSPLRSAVLMRWQLEQTTSHFSISVKIAFQARL